MTLLESIQLERADEQMKSGAWTVKDSDEPQPAAPNCLVCSGPLKRAGSSVCGDCGRKGWRPGPCPKCGGPIHLNCRSKRISGYVWGPCGKCRANQKARAA